MQEERTEIMDKLNKLPSQLRTQAERLQKLQMENEVTSLTKVISQHKYQIKKL